jgi:AcrR family transcriptional regulator
MRTATPRRKTAELTRRKLLEAGQAAFAARGHDGVNLHRDVLGPAGVSVGSFYHQFRDKTDLLVAILDEASERNRPVLTEIVDIDPCDPELNTRVSYDRWFSAIDSSEDIFRILLRERDNDDERIRELLARIRQGWIEAWTGTYERFATDDTSFDPRQAAQTVVALGLGLLLVYLDAPPEARPALKQELLSAVVPFTLGGFAGLGAVKPDEADGDLG